MMLIHLLVGTAVVGLAVVAGVASFLGRSRSVATIAGWALALLVVQATTGMFLLTATEEGPGPLHIALPMVALAAAALARFARPGPSTRRDPLAGAVYTFVALGALVGLITGLAGG